MLTQAVTTSSRQVKSRLGYLVMLHLQHTSSPYASKHAYNRHTTCHPQTCQAVLSTLHSVESWQEQDSRVNNVPMPTSEMLYARTPSIKIMSTSPPVYDPISQGAGLQGLQVELLPGHSQMSLEQSPPGYLTCTPRQAHRQRTQQQLGLVQQPPPACLPCLSAGSCCGAGAMCHRSVVDTGVPQGQDDPRQEQLW